MKGLSKSRYTKFCQCPKALWLHLYQPELEIIDDSLQGRFEEGNKVGNLAMGLFGPYVDVTTYKEDGVLDIPTMVSKTLQEIEKGTQNICEASFTYVSQGCMNYCAVDILHKTPTGWAIYEVKSSSYRSEKEDTPKELRKYTRDIAYQKWILENYGINITGTYLVRLDSNYEREGELDIQNLFHIKDVRDLVDLEYKLVVNNINSAIKIILGDEPELTISQHCQDPYNCGFIEYCKGDLPKPNVFDLYRMWFSKKCEHFHNGKITFEQCKDLALNPIQMLQVDCYLEHRKHINKEEIKNFLSTLHYPLYFLDFETLQPAIPPFDKSHPYQQLPFQYSLHWIEELDGELKHSEYLGDSINDPRRELAQQLCDEIPFDACVTAYNKSFECSRLEEMAEIFPDLRDHLLAISHNIIDLIEPFRKTMVYYPAMNGSFSIKKVLPALFPDDPELDYSNLTGSVHHGGEAMKIYPEIANMNEIEAAMARKSLLEYCHLDTLAMVKVWQKLIELSEAN